MSAAPSTTCRPSATSTRASLPVVVVLPVPFTPTISSTDGPAVVRQRPHRPVHVRADGVDQHPAQQRPGAGRVGDAVRGHLGPQPFGDLRGGAGAQVGHQQGVLDVGPGVLVERAGAEQAEQRLAEHVLRPGQPAAEPVQPTRGRRDLVERRVRPRRPRGRATATGRRRGAQLPRTRTSSTTTSTITSSMTVDDVSCRRLRDHDLLGDDLFRDDLFGGAASAPSAPVGAGGASGRATSTMCRDGESRGIAASSPTAGWPSTSVRSGSGCTGGSADHGERLGDGGGSAAAVAVPDPRPPEENEIDPPALYPPLAGGPSVTGFGGGGSVFQRDAAPAREHRSGAQRNGQHDDNSDDNPDPGWHRPILTDSADSQSQPPSKIRSTTLRARRVARR